eukprot:TRINITY_DN7741_c0_g1_i1.p1 TRINITY_DN7741_c0_g1~~TRINITY_DN7741_c0_g1_i1.p1  ORF type:complete len:201 (-),score=66.54 TRINITY_DN7741_c0_g1_i1:197-799(-)
MEVNDIHIKCVLVGDGAVGKTSMLISYTEGMFPEEYVPTVFDNYTTTIQIDGEVITLALWDTAGQEQYARLRSLSYPETDVFVFCYSVVSRSSFENVEARWHPEISHHAPGVATILVGTKIDIRNDPKKMKKITEDEGESLPTKEMADNLMKKIGSKLSLECSALSQEGLKEVFEGAVKAALRKFDSGHKQKKSPKCAIL